MLENQDGRIFLLKISIITTNQIFPTIRALRNGISIDALTIPKEFKTVRNAPSVMFCGSATGEMLFAYVVYKADKM